MIARNSRDQKFTCIEQNFNTNKTEVCKSYVYDDTYFDETLTTKFDLVCNNEYYRNLLGTIMIFALMVGSLIGGRIGDKFGRKKAFFCATAVSIPALIGSGYIDSYIGKP